MKQLAAVVCMTGLAALGAAAAAATPEPHRTTREQSASVGAATAHASPVMARHPVAARALPTPNGQIAGKARKPRVLSNAARTAPARIGGPAAH